MLGKRTRPVDNALTPSKRVVTEYIPSSKPGAASVTIAKTSTPLARSLSQKENERVGPLVQPAYDDVFVADVGEELDLGEYVLPIPPLAPDYEPVEVAVPANLPTLHGVRKIYAHAYSLLSPSLSTGALSLLGRADQRETLLAFLARRLPAAYASLDAAGPSTPTRGPGPAAMYVSGPPGIGKTALIGVVVDQLREHIRERKLDGDIRVAMENCATVAAGGVDSDKAWVRLGTALGIDMHSDSTVTAKERFEEGLRDGRTYLLVLDEIDHLVGPSTPSSRPSASQRPDLLNALFALASNPASPLTLIGIANDLTLKALSLAATPSPIIKGKGKAKADPLLTPVKPIRLHFKPYSWQELVAIVDQRISLLARVCPDAAPHSSTTIDPASLPASAPAKTGIALIDKPALDRCAKKVASGTGDVRTMLDVVRRAIAAVAHAQAAAGTDLESLTPATAPKAGMKHVSAALASSSGLTAAPSLAARLCALQGGPHQRFVLVSTVIALSRLDLPATSEGGCAGLDRPSSSYETARVTVDAAYQVYRELMLREDVLRPFALDQATFVETLGMVEDLGGFVIVRGRPGSSPSPSPSKKQGRTLTPTKLKRGERGRLTVELAHTAPMADLVAALVQAPPVGREGEEDEAVRLARRALERERSDQRWRVKRTQLGRDEERRAEQELEGRDWERRLLAGEEAGERA